MFVKGAPGALVPISGTDPTLGAWTHRAFVPDPLALSMPALTPETFLAVSEARAALAALDSTARQLPNPTLLRMPTLRREAQSTSALEGTYAPLADVLTADEDSPASAELTEVLNYVRMATTGYDRVAEGRRLTPSLISDLQGILMRGTPLESVSGRIRDGQVVVGRRPSADPFGFPVHAARFVPSPAGLPLEAGVRDLTDWMLTDHTGRIDPVVVAAMSHYQFETLHPFRDGNGRLGRFLVVIQLLLTGVLSEPTLTVSPWFEARRTEYYDHLLGVSARGDWDSFVRFFASGLQAAAHQTREQMIALVKTQGELKEIVCSSRLRADTAHALVDLAIANPSFTVRRVQAELAISYGRANALVAQLTELGVLAVVDAQAYVRRFYSPQVLGVLTSN
ncbi:Fic family protein [Herbiconiux moechotypicola]|uniref:Fic family protein n=1 Tax=Herbiconiux moechotypicola TaxID=637393 RepID=A0ABN3DDH2_9MICO|nr:Fic/DOC family N-terminal domain-containing protein [Herbiconiux moechotypicola]MCS5728676.1 Fic family protein [Herbiconiux moechotypicola]